MMVRFAGRFACGKDGGGGGGGGVGGGGGGVEDLEEVDGFGDACGFGDVCGCGEVGVVGVVGVTGFGHDACEYLILRSLELARVSLSGARKPSDFQTPEPLLISTPCALICRKMTVGMVAMMNVKLDHFPGNTFCGLHLVHDTDGPKVVHCRGVLEAKWNKDFNNSCYLFVFGPTLVILTADCGCGIFEPSQGLFMVAVEDTAL